MHIPVLTKEVLELLDPKENENFIDCAVGQGGHARLILERTGPSGRLLGVDLDPLQIENCKENLAEFKDRLVLINDSYGNLKKIVERENFESIDGVLLDLGFSSWQLEKSGRPACAGRGFSFLKDEPLDMRYSQKGELTAELIVNKWPEQEIEKILKSYGEEKFSKKIASEIIKERKLKPIKTTFQLVEAIKSAIPEKFQHGKIHFATRTFQALRIAVNDELENLKKVLPQIISILKTGGRIIVISFHSLEDRIVKNFLKDNKNLLNILTKKPMQASEDEKIINPRSRSAKLRAAIKK